MKLMDIGAGNGDSALHFVSDPNIDAIEAYEPNNSFADIWQSISKYYPKVKFIDKAVYTYNGETDYYQRPAELSLGSTIMADKIGAEHEVKKVECVDILDIIKEKCFLKIDAEGAEYDILERLIENDKADLIDRLYVEWHDSKMTSDNYARQVVITNYFRSRIQSWL